MEICEFLDAREHHQLTHSRRCCLFASQDKAYDNEQKYKEGKYILEKTRLSEVQ